MTRNRKSAQSDKNAEAYRQAQILLKERAEGYVPYNKILTTIEEVHRTFPKKVGGDLLFYIGHQFFWKQEKGRPLLLFARNPSSDRLKHKGLVEVCRFAVPEKWTGIGRFKIDYVDSKEGMGPLLITLYLYSVDPSDFEKLLEDDPAIAAYLATIYLNGLNSEIFCEQAEERYDSLQ